MLRRSSLFTSLSEFSSAKLHFADFSDISSTSRFLSSDIPVPFYHAFRGCVSDALFPSAVSSYIFHVALGNQGQPIALHVELLSTH
ncbi:hypothetical protein AFLA_004725 [Aspergillus flavus NRRL3357]|nr:hypothetical protein AFLA_004725 [Aspergillus flavus NRRL3357]